MPVPLPPARIGLVFVTSIFPPAPVALLIAKSIIFPPLPFPTVLCAVTPARLIVPPSADPPVTVSVLASAVKLTPVRTVMLPAFPLLLDDDKLPAIALMSCPETNRMPPGAVTAPLIVTVPAPAIERLEALIAPSPTVPPPVTVIGPLEWRLPLVWTIGPLPLSLMATEFVPV